MTRFLVGHIHSTASAGLGVRGIWSAIGSRTVMREGDLSVRGDFSRPEVMAPGMPNGI